MPPRARCTELPLVAIRCASYGPFFRVGTAASCLVVAGPVAAPSPPPVAPSLFRDSWLQTRRGLKAGPVRPPGPCAPSGPCAPLPGLCALPALCCPPGPVRPSPSCALSGPFAPSPRAPG